MGETESLDVCGQQHRYQNRQKHAEKDKRKKEEKNMRLLSCFRC